MCGRTARTTLHSGTPSPFHVSSPSTSIPASTSTARSMPPTPSISSNCALICVDTVSAHGTCGMSRSVQNVRAKDSGVTSFSWTFQTKQSRIRWVSVSNSTRIGTREVGRVDCSCRESSELQTPPWSASERHDNIYQERDAQVFVLCRIYPLRRDEPTRWH